MAFTFFFRDTQTLRLAIEHFHPYIQSRSKISVWSAGCAQGQEPYTFAILLREIIGPYLFRNTKIYATDMDQYDQYGKIITEGRYPVKDLERIPGDIFARYFSVDPADSAYCIISDEIRNVVEFQKHDLLTFKPIRSGIHLIICKNVLLHFTPEERIKAWQMFWSSLEDGGFMLHEHTQKLPDELHDKFEPIVMNAQIFRKRGEDEGS